MSRRLRTLWVTNDFPPRSGGIEQFLFNVLRWTDTSATLVLTSQFPGAAAHDATLPYEVRRVARRPLLPTPRLGRMVRAAVRQHAADVVVFGAAWPLAELAGVAGVPAVALTHGHEAGIVRVGGGPLIRHALRNVAAIGVISRFTAQALRPWVPARTSLHHVPPGVDVERFAPGRDAAAVRARYGIPAAAPLVLCLSRLVRRKGQDTLIRAWPQVRRQVDAHLLLAGGGPLDAALRRQALRSGGADDIHFTGDVAAADVPALHAAADVFAMPCRTRLGGLDVEGLGIVYLEAQATATAVIAGTSGGAPESLIDGTTGLVVDPRSSSAVATAVVDLLTDRSRRERMGAAGRAFVSQTYAWPVVARRFSALVDAAVDRA